MALAVEDRPVHLWQPGQPFPLQLSTLMMHEIWAHNAFFERSIWENICVKRMGWPEIKPEQWRCSAAKVAARSLPRSLANSAAALRVQFQKDTGGYTLMMKMCKPYRSAAKDDVKGALKKEHDIMDLYRLYDYCKRDVETERAVSKVVRDLSPTELKVWQLDQKINHRGVLVDRKACLGAIQCIKKQEEKLTAEFQKLVGGKVKTVTQRDAMLRWLKDEGTDMSGLAKSQVITTLGGELSPTVRRVLEIRQQLSRTSTAKFQTMLNSAGKDGRIRDILMYHGAGTGRWTGKLVQMQNLPRGTVTPTEETFTALKAGKVTDMATISSCIRGMIVAAPGKEFIAADYASIEARVLFWLANEEGGLHGYRTKQDLYVSMAKRIYTDGQEITKTRRSVGKTTILGCGYGMGPGKFRDALRVNADVEVTEEFARTIVDTYRRTFPAVPKFWYETERAAITAVKNPGKKVPCGKVVWGCDKDDVLYCRLPSGRLLSYNQPRIKPSEKFEGKTEISCMVSAQGVWVREATYGGKLVENITQAVARDLMAEAMLKLEAAGYPVVLSVHDEVVSELVEGQGDLGSFTAIMSAVPTWAEGCPVEAEGWKGKRYKK